MVEYTKIETLFKRDIEGTKKLIEGDFRNETVEFLKDNQWEFTEKIDGTNIGIVWDGHKVSYQGRTERAQIPAHHSNLWLKRDAIEDIAKTFGIDVVPIVLTGTLKDGVDFVKTFPKSTMGTANMEGVVGKPKVDMLDRMGRRMIVKIKCSDFR